MDPSRRYRWLCHYLRRQTEGDRIDRENRKIKSIYRDVNQTHLQLTSSSKSERTDAAKHFERIERLLRKKSKIKSGDIHFGFNSKNIIYRVERSSKDMAFKMVCDYDMKINDVDDESAETIVSFDRENLMDIKRGGISVHVIIYTFLDHSPAPGAIIQRPDNYSSVRFFYNRDELAKFKFAEFPDIVAAVRAKLFQNTMIGHLQYTEVIERVRKWQKSKT